MNFYSAGYQKLNCSQLNVYSSHLCSHLYRKIPQNQGVHVCAYVSMHTCGRGVWSLVSARITGFHRDGSNPAFPKVIIRSKWPLSNHRASAGHRLSCCKVIALVQCTFLWPLHEAAGGRTSCVAVCILPTHWVISSCFPSWWRRHPMPHSLPRLSLKKVDKMCYRSLRSLVFFFLFFFGGTGNWTQGFALARRALYCLSHASSTFLLDRVLLFA
jgi:hypothetical protein